jgi:hypothetical protein
MFRILHVPDDLTAASASRIAEAAWVVADRFSGALPADVSGIAVKLRKPFKHGFQPVLLIAEGAQHRVLGFVLALHQTELHFVYLDYLASGRGGKGSGVGSALNDRVGHITRDFDAKGIFLECLPDTKDLCPDSALRAENARRPKFYARFGAYPIARPPAAIGTAGSPLLVTINAAHDIHHVRERG